MTSPSVSGGMTGPGYDAAAVRAALSSGGSGGSGGTGGTRGAGRSDGAGTMWRDVRVVVQTGSTSSDLADLARAGAPEGTVLVADHQVAGRGRLDRTWHTPPGTGIAVSMLFRPVQVPTSRWPWLSLLVGVAAVRAVRASTGVQAALKWPNDVLVGGLKIAGILAEAVPAAGAAVIVGVGLNVTVAAEDLPATATSLLLAGATAPDRLGVLTALLADVDAIYGDWRRSGWDPEWLRAAYLPRCATIGSAVEVSRPAADALHGLAVDIDLDGRLVVRTVSGDVAVSVGDVVHLRKGPES